MAIQLPESAERLLERGEEYNYDNCKVLAYKLKDLGNGDLVHACEEATESYARHILYWPNGRLAKPDIFEPVNSDTTFEDIGACVEHFFHQLQTLLDANPPKMLPTYSGAFVAISREGLPTESTLVLLHKPHEQEWRVDCVQCPIEVELGLTVSSLTMVDETAENVIANLGNER